MKYRMGFWSMPPNILLALGYKVVGCLGTEPGLGMFDILAIQGKLPALRIDLGYLRTAIERGNDRGAEAERDACVIVVADALYVIAFETYRHANGDMVMMSYTGFDFKKDSIADFSPMSPPTNLRAKHYGLTGSIQLLCGAVNRARVYMVEYRVGPDGPWISVPTFPSTRRMILHGLTPGLMHDFRICVVGHTGTSDWSQLISIMPV